MQGLCIPLRLIDSFRCITGISLSVAIVNKAVVLKYPAYY